MLLRKALAAVAGGVLLVGSGPAAAVTRSAVQLTARLRVAERRVVQLHGVLLDAHGSRGQIAAYEFHFGDGVVEQGTQPLALHGYRRPGRYRAYVVVIARSGRRARSSSVSVAVLDGLPPRVQISFPRPYRSEHIGPAGLVLRGSARDAGGVTRVQLAIQLVSSHRRFATGGSCIWYDAHTWLVLSACANPYFFDVRVRRSGWTFRVPSAARLPHGVYVMRVRAVDRAGNVSHFYALRLRTVVPFTLS